MFSEQHTFLLIEFATIACRVQSNILATVIEDEAQFTHPGIM